MAAFLFAVNAVMPIILMVALGYFIKKIGLVKFEHAKVLNKMVFRIFLPVMLFLSVYNIESLGNLEYGYALYVVAAAVILFLVGIPVVILITKDNGRRGAILQSIFRSNYALIGIPLTEALFGQQGVLAATLLSAIIVPSFNILAVISLSIFSNGISKPNLKKIISGILKNPLILSIGLALIMLLIRSVFINYNIDIGLLDIKPLSKVLNYLSSVATPLALLVLGIQFEFSAISSLKREIFTGVIIRSVFVPLLCIGIAVLFFKNYFSGAQFATFIAVFATPVAVSSVPMAQEMNSDVTLTGQLVVWTTLASGVTIFLASFILRLIGIL